MGRDPFYPNLVDGLSPRQRGEPVGFTVCGCALATCVERWMPGVTRCSGCGRDVSRAEERLRLRALDQAFLCRAMELARG